MEEYRYSKYTRAVRKELLNECKDNGKFDAFIKFVKRSNDLELCFRGNSDFQYGMISIYRNNHTIWNLFIDNNENRVVSVSTDHCRFMSDWKEYAIKGLMDLGFVPAKGEISKCSYEDLLRDHLLANKLEGNADEESEKNTKFSAIDLQYVITDHVSGEDIERVVEKSYIILCRMQEEFFHPLGYNCVLIKDSYKPINFLKAYVEYETPDRIRAKKIDAMLSRALPCVEKHVQQEIFTLNKKTRAGLLVYDLEFSQPAIEGLGKVRNQPDMFAIRFDKNGKMVAIVLVEVKSTKSALMGNSGVKEHLEGMIDYIDKSSSAGLLMDHRREEAHNILSQYKELGFFESQGIDIDLKLEDFMKLPVEIMLVFSHGINSDTTVTKDKTIDDIFDEIIKTNQKYKIDKSSYAYIRHGEQSRAIATYRFTFEIK